MADARLIPEPTAAVQARFDAFFAEKLMPLNQQLEARRSRYLARLRQRGVLCGLAFVLMPLYLPWLYDILNAAPEKGQRGFGFYFLATVLTLVLAGYALRPIISYRQHIRNLGTRFGFLPIRDHGDTVSLKAMLYGDVFRQFGEFTYRPRGMNARINLMNPLLLPPHDEYRAEDNVSGVMEGNQLDIAEAQIVAKVGDKRHSLFRGLSITIDMVETDLLKLRAPFRGKTAVIDRKQRNLQYVRERFKNFKTIDPIAPEHSLQFEIHTTDVEEATAVVTPLLLDLIQQLGNLFNTVNLPPTSWDDKVWRFLADPLGPRSHGVDKDAASSGAVFSINNSIMMALNGDKVQITVPYQHHLFEPPSLFSSPLEKQEMFLIFRLMELLQAISAEINRGKATLDTPFPELDS